MSKAEEELALQIRALKLPEPQREYRFHEHRRWRFDFAWPEQRFAVEVEGVTYYGKNANGSQRLGRHQTAKGMQADCEKYGEAMLLGWNVYRCTQQMVRTGKAIHIIKALLERNDSGSVGEAVRKNRERMGITQSQLAEKLNVSRCTVTHWEKGYTRVRESYIRKLCAIFGIDANRLYGAIN